MKVSEVMVTEVACCSPQTSLQDIAMLMWNNDCGAIPLVDEQEHPVGIITDRDICMGAALQHKPLWELRGEDISSHRELYCCGPDDSIKEALQLMETHEIRRLPVINQYSQLCGMVSMGDIVSFTGAESARKAGDKKISSKETMEFLRHISAHHPSHKATATL
ncbi:CBS domain-containing protein [Marinobacter sp. TBZ242]|uniref:CBS domain-containing protein n=1 Tax=Marinobacter azerbaijanicus TaxID=3050455 RepID=A0ABT7IHL6_9GAMM|nr:CBS domain-containing protein [Marinobacter sp. TBZ242]MDL0432648.1 CBS domain-containing protein [Marinobacter sp. TBZ242]